MCSVAIACDPNTQLTETQGRIEDFRAAKARIRTARPVHEKTGKSPQQHRNNTATTPQNSAL
jgi:hypothetical protein